MVQSMDKERAMGIIKHEKYWYELSRFTGYRKSRGFFQ